MFKTIVSLSVLGFGTLAFSADLKITSWEAISNDINIHAGEICGQVVGGNGSEKILILADPGKHQGEYVTLVSPTGSFCQIIGTYNGTVDVAIMGTNVKVTAKK